MAQAALIIALITFVFVLTILVLAALGVGDKSQPLLGEPIVSHHIGAVLQELGHPTSITGLSSGNLVTPCRELLGFSIGETGASTAKVRLRDGGSGGTILAVANFTANADKTIWFSDEGVEVPSGVLYYEKVAGAVEGSVFTV